MTSVESSSDSEAEELLKYFAKLNYDDLEGQSSQSYEASIKFVTGRRWWISVLYQLNGMFTSEKKRQDANKFLGVT